MYGSTQIFMERFAKEYFNHTDWETGKAMWINGVPSFFANMYSDKSYTLSDGIIKLMNVVDFDRMAELPGGVNVDEMISRARNLAFSPQTAGEHFMQNTAMFAMMNSHRVYTDNRGRLVIASFDKYKLDNEILALKSVIGNDAELMAKYEKYPKDIKSDANQTKDFATFRKYHISEFIINNLSNEQKKEYINKKNDFNDEAKTKFEINPKLIDEFELRDGVAVLKPDSKLGQLSEDEANKMLALFKGKVISVNKKIHSAHGMVNVRVAGFFGFGKNIRKFNVFPDHLGVSIFERIERLDADGKARIDADQNILHTFLLLLLVIIYILFHSRIANTSADQNDSGKDERNNDSDMGNEQD